MARTVFFTICARNFLAYARQLGERVREFHPHVSYHVFIADEHDGVDYNGICATTLGLDKLNIDNIEVMKRQYNITEFCTSIKPFAFSYLFEKGFQQAIYLDPDILVKSELSEVFDLFNEGATCVLTPHHTTPLPVGEIDDFRLLQLGTFNLGFCALQDSAETRALVDWWKWRLRTHCLIDLERGLFVDQKWADHFPSYVSNFRSLRHAGYNVAYWNLHQRKVTRRDGLYEVNGQPLRFFHFSGSNIRERSRLTRHISNTERVRLGPVAELLDEYANAVIAHGHEIYEGIPYAFSWNGARGVNLHTPGQRTSDAQSERPSARARLWSIATGAQLAVSRHGLRGLAVKGIRHINRHGIIDLLRFVDRRWAPLALQVPLDLARRTPDLIRKETYKSVLFVDVSLPNPTIDAGGLFSFQIVRALRELGMSVTVLALGGSAQEHTGLYDELGVRIVEGRGKTPGAHIRASAGTFDAIVLNRSPAVFPLMADLLEYHRSAALIINTHDLHYVREEREAAVIGLPGLREQVAATKQRELQTLESCDVVWIVSDTETYLLGEVQDDAPIILQPLVVDVAIDEVTKTNRDRLIFIGSFGHRPNADAVSSFVSSVWPEVSEAFPDLRLQVIGSNFPSDLAWVRRAKGVEVVGHVENLAPQFSRAIASIAPLRFGAGVKGKLLTSWSYGVPVIGSAVAAEGLPNISAAAFIQAGEANDYVAAIRRLSDDANWEFASKEARRYLESRFCTAKLRDKLRNLFDGLAAGCGPIPNWHRVEDYTGYLRHEELSSKSWLLRREHERRLVDSATDLVATTGYCVVCGQPSTFGTSYQWSSSTYDDGRAEPNWREHVACSRCGLVTRLRAVWHFMHTLSLPTTASIYMTEQITHFFSRVAQRFPNTVGSEFLGGDHIGGETVRGLRHEDLQHLSFASGKFDVIISLDVLEHVPNFEAALEEIYRCLKPGGRAIVTVPFSCRSPINVIRAEVDPGGTINHLLPPEYHGNPVDHEGGSLCYRYYGWELLDHARAMGFSSAAGYSYWSRRYQYLGTENWIFEFVR